MILQISATVTGPDQSVLTGSVQVEVNVPAAPQADLASEARSLGWGVA